MISKLLPILYITLAELAALGILYWTVPIKPFDLNGVSVRLLEKPAFAWRWRQ